MDNSAIPIRAESLQSRTGRESDGALRRSFHDRPPSPNMPRVYRRTRYGQKVGPVFLPLAKICRSRRSAPLLTFAACADPCKGMVGAEEWPLVLIEQRNGEGERPIGYGFTGWPLHSGESEKRHSGGVCSRQQSEAGNQER